jgi:DUF1680 family protein
MMWNWRMLAASGDAKFTDVIERALYNGINSGMSLDGKTYCYRNPLSFDPSGDSRYQEDPEGKIRNPWYYTTCCPPNIERTFASLPGYFYSTSSDGVYVHLYDNSEMNWHLQDGTPLQIRQSTNYPWNGEVKIAVTPSTSKDFVVYLRIPGWSRNTIVKVNGRPVENARPGHYLAVRRQWAQNDTIELTFDMTTRMLEANPAVNEDRGRIAFQRGPVVYCMEHIDQADPQRARNLVGYSVSLHGQTATRFEPSLLEGVVVLEHPGSVAQLDTAQALYAPVTEARKPEASATTLKLIPYYAWANRTPAAMQVGIPYNQT